jgi:hypothetical protein
MEELLGLFAQTYQVEFINRLGEGKDGEVFQTDCLTGVKFLHVLDHYNREVRAYRVLASLKIDNIAGQNVPRLVRCDDTLLAIEMSIVQPPFIVDFVSAYTDEEIEKLGFDEDVIAERQIFWQERFGDRWPKVMTICDQFHRLTGLTLLDLSHNNIRFE